MLFSLLVVQGPVDADGLPCESHGRRGFHMVRHHLDKLIPEDIAFAESQIRAETVAAEDILRDLGAISIIRLDSQAWEGSEKSLVGREEQRPKMKDFKGFLTEEEKLRGDDNNCVKRCLSKHTINPLAQFSVTSKREETDGAKF
ncbi:hypothetical protein KEM48_006156 [Puccinia striiformis f. sp. tritici PST-130]|nr:hypothetical protein KEM48_006156 [Puccinia striiformis f. sp. tritici PST-130]